MRAVHITGCLVLSLVFCAECYGVTIGSKKFTENVLLAEIVTRLLDSAGIEAEHQQELGGTRIVWDALLTGDIDVYPEYSGTLIHEIFSSRTIADHQALVMLLDEMDIGISEPLGFNNTYILGMRRDDAAAKNIQAISDLQSHSGLRFGFSNEFLARADGWPGLRQAYHLQQASVTGLDHDLAYRGLAAGDLDVIDLYATDAEIAYYNLATLADDRGYFPEYLAVIVFRKAVAREHPAIQQELARLSGRIDSERMSGMNADVKLHGRTESEVAAEFVRQEFGVASPAGQSDWLDNVLQRSYEHLVLVLLSLSAAIVVAVPLGITAARNPRIGQVILSLTGIIQTIPALALLVFMIPLLGIGGPPAIMALFLYSLLPIVRNTHSGLRDIPEGLIESATVMGLPTRARLRLIELPLAARSILAGIKTSAVINVGTATLGALIGAGGYGQPILTGIRLNDMGLILSGAIPAALLALLVQGVFELVERRVVRKW